MAPIRIVFLGTAELACRSLQALAESPEIEILGVVSQPDKARGRQLRLTPTAVKTTALQHSLPVWQPQRLRRDEDLINRLKGLSLDLLVVAAYGQILPESVLSIPRFGCINVHTSLLPKYRGAAPIHWAILNGDQETGVTLMKMDAGLDTGEIITQRKTAIGKEETAGELHDRLAALGASFLVESLPTYIRGEFPLHAQVHAEASHARKLTKADAQVDWSRPAVCIHNQIRGLNPWPGTFSHLKLGESQKLIKFWSAVLGSTDARGRPGDILSVSSNGIEVACGDGSIMITVLQREGAKRLPVAAFLAGFPVTTDNQFFTNPSSIDE